MTTFSRLISLAAIVLFAAGPVVPVGFLWQQSGRLPVVITTPVPQPTSAPERPTLPSIGSAPTHPGFVPPLESPIGGMPIGILPTDTPTPIP